jgi:hypothetical protein
VMTHRDTPNAESEIYWLCVAAYIVRAIGKLTPQNEADLDRITENQWRSMVERELEVDADFIKSVYDCCTDRMESNRALLFILRGFGCPTPAERLREVLG